MQARMRACAAGPAWLTFWSINGALVRHTAGRANSGTEIGSKSNFAETTFDGVKAELHNDDAKTVKSVSMLSIEIHNEHPDS